SPPPLGNAQKGVIYLGQADDGMPRLKLLASYADAGSGEDGGGHSDHLQIGESLIGQCAADARRMLITEIPPNVVPIRSGLFRVMPKNVIVLPVLFEGNVKAVIELPSVRAFPHLQTPFLDHPTANIRAVATRTPP